MARDGWILHKIYKKYFNNIDSSYVYLNRILGIKGLLEWCDEPRYLMTLLKEANQDIADIEVSQSFNKNLEIFDRNKNKLLYWSKDLKKELTAHIFKNAGDSQRILLVDTTTGAFSSLKFAKKILGNRIILGVFTGTYVDKSNELYYSTFFKNPFTIKEEGLVKLIEFLLSAPEKPIKSIIRGKVVYSSPEGIKHVVYERVAEGIFQYVDDYISHWGLVSTMLPSADEWQLFAQHYIENISQTEVKYFEEVLFSSEPDNNSKEHSLKEIFGK